MAAQRNNFARLSRETRRRIMYLRVNGAMQQEIRDDPEVAAELARRKITLHSTTFLAIERGEEYAAFKRALDTTERQVADDRRLAEALRDCAGITSIADVTQLELLKQLREFAKAGAGDPAELLKLATAVTRIKAADGDDRIKRLTRQLEDEKQAAAARESEYQSRIVELEQKLAELAAKVGPANSGAVIEEMDRFVKGE